MNTSLKEIAGLWPSIETILPVPHTREDYERLVCLLDSLIDEVGNDESHLLASLMGTIGTLVETYESSTLPEMPGSPIDALKALMGDRGRAGLPQRDFHIRRWPD